MRAILVESAHRESSAPMLRDLGYVIEQDDVLYDGTDVLLLLAKEPPPEVLIIDVRLPGWDGTEVLAAVRGAGTRGQTPAIVMVSDEDKVTNGVIDMIRDRSAIFLARPFTRAELASAIERAQVASTDWEITTLSMEIPSALLA